MFNLIDIYSFINVSGCVDRSPTTLLCPGAYNAVKTALEGGIVLPLSMIFRLDYGTLQTVWFSFYYKDWAYFTYIKHKICSFELCIIDYYCTA